MPLGTAFITHPDCWKHEMMLDHPECPDRLNAVEDRLRAAGVFDFLVQLSAPEATREQLARVHDKAYIDLIRSASPEAGLNPIDEDTAMNPHTFDAALRAAGAVVLATDVVLGGQAENAFCNVRPPGHHAERHRAMGFCFFNNIAVGVAHALTAYNLKRVAVVDFDVHHGNGTENTLSDDPRVLVCSTYQHPFYPYSAGESVAGQLINVPLQAGTSGAGFRQAVETHWIPQLEEFQPEMIFISAGFDAHHEDSMAELNFHERDYAWVTQKIMDLAERSAHKRIVSCLEGGYALSALGRCACVHIRALMGL